MNEETVEVIRQEWQKCPFPWGMDDYVTVFTENAGTIILVNVERFSSENSGGIRYRPVKSSDLPMFEGIDSNE